MSADETMGRREKTAVDNCGAKHPKSWWITCQLEPDHFGEHVRDCAPVEVGERLMFSQYTVHWQDPCECDSHTGVGKVPFTIDHLLAHLQIEADFVVDRFVVTRGQRLVLRDMLQRAHDEIERLNDENEALRIDLAAAYCRMDDMEGLGRHDST